MWDVPEILYNNTFHQYLVFFLSYFLPQTEWRWDERHKSNVIQQTYTNVTAGVYYFLVSFCLFFLWTLSISHLECVPVCTIVTIVGAVVTIVQPTATMA